MYKVNEGRPNVAITSSHRSIELVINNDRFGQRFVLRRARRAPRSRRCRTCGPCFSTLANGATAAVSAIRALGLQEADRAKNRCRCLPRSNRRGLSARVVPFATLRRACKAPAVHRRPTAPGPKVPACIASYRRPKSSDLRGLSSARLYAGFQDRPRFFPA
jgi:hypothetical protein